MSKTVNIDVATDLLILKRVYKLTAKERRDLIGLTQPQVVKLQAGKNSNPVAQRYLHGIRIFLDSLAEIVKVEAIPSWLRKKNAAFQNRQPLRVIKDGEIDLLREMVHRLSGSS